MARNTKMAYHDEFLLERGHSRASMLLEATCVKSLEQVHT